MNKYIITSPAFNGEINVLYGMEHKLMFIDFIKADLSKEQIEYFKEKLPALLTHEEGELIEEYLLKQFGKSKLNIIAQGYTITFDTFWTRYDLKRNRIRAEKLWSKLTEADRVNAYGKYPLYERHLQVNHWKSKADPEKYLKERYWESDWSK